MESRKGKQAIGLRAVDGHVHIDGYPDAERLVALETEVGHHLAVLRLYEADLNFCSEAMHKFGQLRVDPVVGEIMLTGIVTKFFSCFGRNRAQFSLDPAKVFKGRSDAREAFNHWKALRDKHVVHNESELTKLVTGLVLGRQGNLIDVLTLQAWPVLALHDDNNQNLFNLIEDTLKHVKSEIDGLLPHAFAEAEKMTPAERLALPAVMYGMPTAQQTKQTRSRGSEPSFKRDKEDVTDETSTEGESY